MEVLAPNMVLPSFKNALLKLDPLEPALSIKEICDLVERTFNIDDIVEYFSDHDIKFVNNHLMKTSGTEISQYPSKKDIVITVTSGFLGWEATTFKNLPFWDYKVNNITFDDFLQASSKYDSEEDIQKGFTFLYLKIICVIIDHEVSQGIYDKPMNSLTEKMEEVVRYPIIDIGFSIGSDEQKLEVAKDRISAIESIHEAIKEWRKERLSK